MKPKIAFIGTGGTIASIGKGPLDILDYGANETMLHAAELLAKFPEVNEVAEVIPVRFRTPDGTVQEGGYVHAMYLDDNSPIAGGREKLSCQSWRA